MFGKKMFVTLFQSLRPPYLQYSTCILMVVVAFCHCLLPPDAQHKSHEPAGLVLTLDLEITSFLLPSGLRSGDRERNPRVDYPLTERIYEADIDINIDDIDRYRCRYR